MPENTPPAVFDVHLDRDADLVHARCPWCGAVDQIAELDDGARINPIVFARGIDNDTVYFTILSTHPDTETQRYLCRACRATVTIPPDISFTS